MAQATLSTGSRPHLVHVAHGPEARYRTPSALCEITGLRLLINRMASAGAGVGSCCRDRTRQEAESERHMDVSSESRQ